MVKIIYQLADLHIPTFKGLDMYAVQLSKIIDSIKDDIEKNNYSSDEVRIALCGDLVHSKNTISNELTVFVSNFIRNLSSLAKVVTIAGNHDLVESNTSRTDTISGIFQTAQFPNATLLDLILGYESGVVYDDNITWAVYSIYDNFNRPDIESARIAQPENKVIGLFHGMLVGCKLFNGFVSDNGTDSETFNGCDGVMAGHIHKRQTITQGDCQIVYSGSPFQQNYGESFTQHGYAKWNVEDMSFEYIDIDNEFGFFDYSISSIKDIKEDKEMLNNF